MADRLMAMKLLEGGGAVEAGAGSGAATERRPEAAQETAEASNISKSGQTDPK